MGKNSRARSVVLLIFALLVFLLPTAVLASVGSAHFKEIPGAQDLQSHNDFAEPDMVCQLRPDGIGVNNLSANLGDGQNVGFLGQIGGSVSAVAVQGNYAYAREGSRLTVLDISDRGEPTLVGQTTSLRGNVVSVAVAGNYAYLAAESAGLRIIDVANPANPAEVGFYDTPGIARGVAVAGDYAYVADDRIGGLRIINITNPAKPKETGFYNTPGIARGVAVAGNYAYVADDAG